MSAIITDKFRRNSVKTLIADTGNDYYIGIGKSDPWPVIAGVSENSASYSTPGPYGSTYEMPEALENLISITKVDNMRHVVPKITLQTGKKYKVYDPTDPNTFFTGDDGLGGTLLPCYAYFPAANAFYVCLRNGGATPGVTANVPTLDKVYAPESLADGYIWAYIEEFETNSPFDTIQYQSIVGNVSNPNIAAATAATGGMLYGLSVQDGGTGYDQGNTVIKFAGTVLDSAGNEEYIEYSSEDVTPITFVVNAGVIESVTLPDPLNAAAFAKGVVKGSITVIDTSSAQSGEGAKVIPMIAPQLGFGADPIADLSTFFLGLSAEFDGTQGGDALLIPYRQISLIKNPEFNGDADGDTVTADALAWFDVTGEPAIALSVGDVMMVENAVGEEPSKLFYDNHEVVAGNTRVYFHQNKEVTVNGGALPATGSVLDENESAVFSYTGISEPEYMRRTGEVLFIENRRPITRSASQNEKIKIILQF